MGERNLNDLMKAVEKVLNDLGDLKGLASPLRSSAERLYKEFQEVQSCCCHDGRIVGPPPPPPPARSQPAARRPAIKRSGKRSRR